MIRYRYVICLDGKSYLKQLMEGKEIKQKQNSFSQILLIVNSIDYEDPKYLADPHKNLLLSKKLTMTDKLRSINNLTKGHQT